MIYRRQRVRKRIDNFLRLNASKKSRNLTTFQEVIIKSNKVKMLEETKNLSNQNTALSQTFEERNHKISNNVNPKTQEDEYEDSNNIKNNKTPFDQRKKVSAFL